MNRTFFVFLAAGIANLAAPYASADVLYGLTSGNPGTIYTINTATGAASTVVNLSNITSLVDVSFLNGTLYATDVFSGVLTFGTVNLTTGAYTVVNNQGGSANWHSLAAIPANNLLYAVDLNTPGDQLVSITPGGVITTIGATNQFIVDLAYDPNLGVLFGVNSSSLYRINPTTGNTTLVGALGISDGRLGLAYDSNNNTLYLNSASSGNFYSVNQTTGAVTAIGNNGPTSGSGIDGLADTAASVPEPGALALLFSAIALTRPWRWKKVG